MAKTKARTAARKKTKTKTARTKKKTAQVTAIATRQVTDLPGYDQMTAIERYVLDPNVDVNKLERVIALQERAQGEASRVAFFAALAPLQARLPKIGKGGTIYSKGGVKVRNKYAKMGDDILPQIKPIMGEFGFSFRSRTEWPEQTGNTKIVRVVGILSHDRGWSEQSVFESPVDTHDSRNYIQSLGSTLSYGRRYTMIDLLTLEMADDDADDDGQAATGKPAARPQPKPTRQRQQPKPQQRQVASPDVVVSDAQLKRLYTIATRAKRETDEIKTWLMVRYNIDSSKQIRQADYDDIITALEAPGPLGNGDREPGEEG